MNNVIVKRWKPNTYVITCNHLITLELMKSISDGFKLRNKASIVVSRKAVPIIMQYTEYNKIPVQISQSDESDVFAVLQNTRHRIAELNRIRKDYDDDTLTFDYKLRGVYAPFKHQIMMYNVCMSLNVCAILSEMGTAKTGPFLWAIDKRIQIGLIKNALVVTLASLKKNVLEEMEKQVPHLKGVVLSGGKKRVSNILNKAFIVSKKNIDYHIYIVNYESLFTLKDLLKDRFNMVVFDEAHRLANPTSRQTKMARAIFEDVTYKILSTGTLYSNKLMSFFMPFRILGHDTLPIANYYTFRQLHFFTVDKDGHIWMPHPTAEPAIKQVTHKISVHFKKIDCLDLPPLLYSKYYCDLTDEQVIAYNIMERSMIGLLECEKCNMRFECLNGKKCDNKVVLENILNKGQKLIQITNGFLYGELNEPKQKRNIVYYKNHKMDLLFDVIDNINSKVVIWSPYIPHLEMISNNADIYKISHIDIWGSVDAFERAKQFNESDTKLLIANQKKAGAGLNLTSASYEIFAANDYSYVYRDQAECRLHRAGQNKAVTVIDLLCEDTIDVLIYKALKEKIDIAQAMVEHIRVRKNVTGKVTTSTNKK